MASPGKIVVGLGNPGPEYSLTRHNIGFMAADAVAEAAGVSSWRRGFRGSFAPASLAGRHFVILKPMTFMNLSGESVHAALGFYKLGAEDVIVFHDDIDLKPGQVKVKRGGGDAGHNGLKSLDARIGKNYLRVRIGIGRPDNKDEVHDYVLGKFSGMDKKWLNPLLDAIAKNFSLLLEDDKETFSRALKGTR